MTEKRTLADTLMDLMALSDKYDFTIEDRLLFMDRCLLLGEAVAFLQELGLGKELDERHNKVCKKTVEMVLK